MAEFGLKSTSRGAQARPPRGRCCTGGFADHAHGVANAWRANRYLAAIDLTSPLLLAALMFSVAATMVLHIGGILRQAYEDHHGTATRDGRCVRTRLRTSAASLTLCDGF
jgi:hypothetical protein